MDQEFYSRRGGRAIWPNAPTRSPGNVFWILPTATTSRAADHRGRPGPSSGRFRFVRCRTTDGPAKHEEGQADRGQMRLQRDRIPPARQPVPGRRIYPAPCEKCGGKGRLRRPSGLGLERASSLSVPASATRPAGRI
jgi:hypothetical protein